MDRLDLSGMTALVTGGYSGRPRACDYRRLAAAGAGWESRLGTNHFGYFALTSELYPLLAAADGARVVINSSAGHTLTDIRWHDPHFRAGYDEWLAYGPAKTANAQFAVPHASGNGPSRRPVAP